MKADTQHLDFLISQYVDGSMDTASRKSIEQQLVNDPAARKLYNDHRETQDLLDDFGNRIPLINWDDFDKTLAARLEKVSVGGDRQAFFRRWARPFAAAAALFIAATIGYSWHALWSSPTKGPIGPIADVVAPSSITKVIFHDVAQQTQPSAIHVVFPEAQGSLTRLIDPSAVAISAPEDTFATQSLRESLQIGLLGLPEAVQPQKSTVGVSVLPKSPAEVPTELPR